jgi:hypothetical protein
VLGLEAPTLDPCANGGCADAAAAVLDASGTSGGDSAAPGDATTAGTPDGSTLDAALDVVPDRGSPDGIRCGPIPSEIFCSDPTPTCCLVLDDTGAASYSCQSGAGACAGYPVACATNNDCPGSEVCCFYNSGIKCEAETTASCANVLVCQQGGPADQCPEGQTCSINYDIDGGFTLPYNGCH